MILTDAEMQEVRRSVETQAGLDDELMQRCGDLIHMSKFDEAVRSAFVLLEERLRKAVTREGMTGTHLANYAFNAQNGPLAMQLGRTQAEREGLRELYSGAFKLFRNPTAHSVVGYDREEGKAIIGLVNLMLKLLDQVDDPPPPGLLPKNVEAAISKVEASIGPGAARRLLIFLGKCIEAGLEPSTHAKQRIPFRQYGLAKLDDWDAPKRHRLAVFRLRVVGQKRGLQFPINYFYEKVVGFGVDRLAEELADLGFQRVGKKRNLRIDLRIHNDQPFFDALFDLVAETAEELEETLQEA